jgi:GDP-4-dehydro-6-deoxy-D-mannose reductase
MNRALITGGTGFVGTYLAAFLRERGSQIAVLASAGCDAKVQTTECYEVDIRDAERVRSAIDDFRPDHIYHLAGVSSVDLSWKSPRLTYEVNVFGTLNVLEAATTLPSPPRILNVSTAQVYGPTRLPISEDSLIGPDNPYAASKAMAELMALQYRNQNTEIVTARSFNHTGPGQSSDFVLSSIARQFAEIEAGLCEPRLAVGNVHVKRDFTDVRDVVRAYTMLLENGASRETYNVCSGCSWSIKELIGQFESASGINVAVETQPERRRTGEISEVRGNPSKIRTAIGWEPQIPLETTIQDLLTYWRSAVHDQNTLQNTSSTALNTYCVSTTPLRSK